MYGIVIEAVRYMIEDHYGSATLALAMEQAHVTNATFSTHDRYSEKIIPNLLVALADITGNSMEDVGVLAGRYFIRFMTKYAQDLLTVLGRRFADFLKGLDSLHEYFRFSYERIRPPSFYCDRESVDGLTLHYRSRRRGYVSYVMGQLIEIAKIYFEQDITVEVTKCEEKKGFQYVLLRVTFDNRDFNDDQMLRDKNTALNEFLPVDSLSVLGMFPYFVAFNKRMEIVVVGRALNHIIPDLISQKIDEQFELVRPCVKFTWDACQHHLNNLFELHSNRPILKTDAPAIAVAVNGMVEEKIALQMNGEGQKDDHQPDDITVGQSASNHREWVWDLPTDSCVLQGIYICTEEFLISALVKFVVLIQLFMDDYGQHARPVVKGRKYHIGNYLHLKGPMVYLKHSEVFLYLPTVLIDVLDNLFELGLYMNDYSASDCNREIIMASAQKSDDLKELLKREKEKSRILAKNMRDIDIHKKTARELLSQLVPKEVANELLQTGKRTLTLTEAYDEVTLAFVRIVDFTAMLSDIAPIGVVNLLNNTFGLLDDIAAKHGVYKVETVGETFVISCGVPYPTQNHAEYVADAALDMLQSVDDAKTKLAEGKKKVTIKIGIHAGPVIGSVVGVRAPKFCLVGDTVNTTARLETHNKQPMTIQVSVKAKVLLESNAPGQYQFESRGKINLKGKGEMLAFGLLSKKGPPRFEKYPLSNTNMADEDDRSAVYTPIDDFDDDSRAGTMSRMSISHAGSRTTSVSSGRIGSGHEDDHEDGMSVGMAVVSTETPAPPREQPSFVRKAKTIAVAEEPDQNGDQIDEARRLKKKNKEDHKERKRQGNSSEPKSHGTAK